MALQIVAKFHAKVLTQVTDGGTKLDLSNKNIRDYGARALAAALPQCMALQKLDIGANRIRDDGTRVLAAALPHCQALQELYFSSNKIGADAARALVAALPHCQALQKLEYPPWPWRLNYNGIGVDGARALAAALSQCKVLQVLYLRDNGIGDDGTCALAAVLPHCTVLNELNLSNNNIGDDGARTLAAVLTQCQALQTLDLFNNGIGDAGRTALACAFIISFQQTRWLVLRELGVNEEEKSLPKIDQLKDLPADVRAQGVKGVLEYLRTLSTSSRLRKRSKVMVVGFQGAGKTSLLSALYPLEEAAISVAVINKPAFLVLQGARLRQYDSLEAFQDGRRKPVMDVTITPKWTLQTVKEDLVLSDTKHTLKYRFASAIARAAFHRALDHSITSGGKATDGIAVRSLRLGPDGQEIVRSPSSSSLASDSHADAATDALQLTAWDFAGQREYYSNRHHFLTDQAVYVVVWDVRKRELTTGEGGLLFWLRTLKAILPALKAGEAPSAAVFVVGTHIDGGPPAIDRDEYVARMVKAAGLAYPYETAYVAAVAPEFTGVDALRPRLATACNGLAGTGELIADWYLAVEAAADQLRGQHVEFPLVRLSTVVATANTLAKEELGVAEVQRALKMLTNWGSLVYKDAPPSLADIVVLSPSFLTQETLAKLFNPANVGLVSTGGRPGRLRPDQLRLIWNAAEYASFHDALIELLVTMGVFFYEGDGEQRVLVVPELLEKREPPAFAQQWRAQKAENEVELRREIHVDVLPPELIAQCLSQLHPDIVNDLVWRHGALLSRGKRVAQAVLRCHGHEGKTTDGVASAGGHLEITVRDVQHQRSEDRLGGRLMSHIADAIHQRLEAYPGLHVEDRIPCPECRKPHCFFSVPQCLEALAEADALGKDDVVASSGGACKLSARAVLEHGGLLEPSAQTGSLVTALAAGANGTFLEQLLERLQRLEGFSFQAAQALVKANYPCMFLALPRRTEKAGRNVVAWLKDRASSLLFQHLTVVPMCEFALVSQGGNAQRLYHPCNVSGAPIDNLKHPEALRRLATVLKVTAILLKVGGLAVRLTTGLAIVGELGHGAE